MFLHYDHMALLFGIEILKLTTLPTMLGAELPARMHREHRSSDHERNAYSLLLFSLSLAVKMFEGIQKA